MKQRALWLFFFTLNLINGVYKQLNKNKLKNIFNN